MEAREIAGQILRSMRIEYGLSQSEVARQINDMDMPNVSLCERHYRRIEKGEMVPSVLLAMAICYVLDIDVYQVWGSMTKDEMAVEIQRMREDYAARDAVIHRLLDTVGHLVLYITSNEDGELPPQPAEEEAN